MAQTAKFQGTARKMVRMMDRMVFMYHNTAVVTKFLDGTIKLNSGGWKSATTKLAMNQASNEWNMKFAVSQRKGEWFVRYNEIDYPFVDGITLGKCDTAVAAFA